MKTKNRHIACRAMCIAIALLMLFTVTPMTVFAEETEAKIYKTGDIIEFGSYPQSEVTDEVLKAKLTELAGSTDEWTSYGYYSRNEETAVPEQGDFMKYVDVECDGAKYRGVYFTKYRPYFTSCSATEDKTWQKDNGYEVNTQYWFKYDSIYWQVLSYDKATGNAVVLSKDIIDSQQYYNNYNERTIDGKTVYPNNYEHSDIRVWLNGTFYDGAFTDAEKNVIIGTTLDNSAYDEDYSQYDSNSTTDKVWLLSYDEAHNADYGFDMEHWSVSETRMAQGSKYTLCQGLWRDTSKDYSIWRLRSAGNYTYYACNVIDNGYVSISNDTFVINHTSLGVRPALKINLMSLSTEPTEKDIIESVTNNIDGVKAVDIENGVRAIAAAGGIDIAVIRRALPAAKIVDKDGNEVSDKTHLATGMKIMLNGESVAIVVLGDVDGNGEINVADARLALRQAVSLENLNGVYLFAGKVGGDSVGVSEARKILRVAVGLDDSKDWLK